jgi:hypothetical protein
MAVSTGTAVGWNGEPPSLVPGLDATVNLPDGGDLLILVDATSHKCHPNVDQGSLLLEVDGATVASRPIAQTDFGPDTGLQPYVITWLAAGLAPGAHQVRVLIACLGSPAGGAPTPCIGSADPDENQARLIVIGFPPPP